MKVRGGQKMITLYRAIKLWQLQTKWRLAIWQYIDSQATELIKNPGEVQKKLAAVINDALQRQK